MLIVGINWILSWVQITTGTGTYTCPMKEEADDFYFRFKGQWHSVSEYAPERLRAEILSHKQGKYCCWFAQNYYRKDAAIMLLEGELMKIILVKTGTFPCIMNVPHELAFLQALVGGNIEVVEPFDDDVILVCNECGRNEGRPVNRVINGHMDICGDFFLCGQDEYGLSDIPEDKITPYLDRFQLYPVG